MPVLVVDVAEQDTTRTKARGACQVVPRGNINITALLALCFRLSGTTDFSSELFYRFLDLIIKQKQVFQHAVEF